jgi:hypothetical protein
MQCNTTNAMQFNAIKIEDKLANPKTQNPKPKTHKNSRGLDERDK